MAKKSKKKSSAKKRSKRQAWTRELVADLRRYSKQKLRVTEIAKMTKRTVGAIRAKGVQLGLPLGHRR